MEDGINWLDVVPATMSAFAALAAAYAAIISMHVSKQSNSLAEKIAIASHHNSAASLYFEVVRDLNEETRELSKVSYNLWNEWSKEIETKDNRTLGGVDPRPLRHVLTDSSNILATYGMKTKNWGPFTSRAILSVVIDGIGKTDDSEYLELLKQADGKYHDFDDTFGTPSNSEKISSAPAFRFACYQLMKRVSREDWITIWHEAWLQDGWLVQYKQEYRRVKPILDKAHKSLEGERSRCNDPLILESS